MEKVVPSPEPSSFWPNRSVLITGCAGFLGSWVTRAMVRAGASVTGVLHRELREPSIFKQFGLLDQVRLIQGSTLDLDFLRGAVQNGFDVVIHVAAQAYMPLGRVIPHQTFEANVRGTWNLLEAIRAGNFKTPVVLCSSDCVYGEPDGSLCTEDSPLRGAGPYEVSKICAEQAAVSYSRAFGIPVGVARCSNLYGDGDRELSRIVPGTIRALLSGEAPIIRSNGLAIRDYLHVADAANGLLSLGQALLSDSIQNHCFNFSSERPVNVLEMVQAILRAAGQADVQPAILDQTSKTVSRKEVSSARARAQLGWSPGVSLDEGLRRTFAWHRDYWPVSTRSA